MYGLVMAYMRKKGKSSKIARRKLSLYLVVFIVCWIWDIAYHIYSAIWKNDYCSGYWLAILQKFFTPLQGFLNLWVYGLGNNMFGTVQKKSVLERLRHLEIWI